MPVVFVCEPEWEAALAAELSRVFPGDDVVSGPDAKGCVVLGGATSFDPAALSPIVAFAAQVLPDAAECRAESISQWADFATRLISDRLDRLETPWRLHVYGPEAAVGAVSGGRVQLVRKAIVDKLREVRRRLLRRRNERDDAPWLPGEALVQVLMTAPERGWISIADATEREAWRYVIAPQPAGWIEPAVDKLAPSRAFAKLVEAEVRLGRKIAAGETCVDLGAAPGSWTYTALNRGALVTAVDRSELRDDLTADPRLTFLRGDAFAYFPDRPVDWLLSDVIAFPDRIGELLARWLGERRCRRFVVTVKFRGRDDDAELERLKEVLRGSGYRFGLRRLTANKNEACAYGEAASGE